jgi:hypothetical protein
MLADQQLQQPRQALWGSASVSEYLW